MERKIKDRVYRIEDVKAPSCSKCGIQSPDVALIYQGQRKFWSCAKCWVSKALKEEVVP